jgi:hypothetical protein
MILHVILLCEKYPRAENCSWGRGEELKLHYGFQLRFVHKRTWNAYFDMHFTFQNTWPLFVHFSPIQISWEKMNCLLPSAFILGNALKSKQGIPWRSAAQAQLGHHLSWECQGHVKHSQKICSVFGGHLIFINFPPKKWGGYYAYSSIVRGFFHL